MRILAINNYSLEKALRNALDKTGPAHHAWGIDYLKERGNHVDCLEYKISRKGKIRTHVKNFFFNIKSLVLFSKYDIIISFANPIIGWYALMKSIGLINCKLYTFVHHHTRIMYLSTGYDKIFFLSKEILELTKKHYPKLANRMLYIEWGSDISFYKDSFEQVLNNSCSECTLISNGKTRRDLILIENACRKIEVPLIIITDIVKGSHEASISSGTSGVNAISYSDLLSYMNQSKISLIPVETCALEGTLSGLTSLLDALAVGHPVIISDNTNISIDIEKLKIGLYYKAGDEHDFIATVQKMLANPEMIKTFGINARKYAEKHTYLDYCLNLEREIF